MYMKQNIFLDHMLGLVLSVFDGYSAVLFLPNETPDVFSPAVYFSLGDKIEDQATIQAGQGLIGWIVRNKQPLLINNFDRKRSKLGYYKKDEETKVKAFMGCPLKKGQGVLCLDSKRTYSFSEKDQKLLQLFADVIVELKNQCSEMNESMREYRFYQCLQLVLELNRLHTRWNVYLDRLLGLLAETTGFEVCFFAAGDEDGASYYVEGASKNILPGKNSTPSFPFGAGLVGWVFKNAQPVFSGETAPAGKSLPLFGGEVKMPRFKSFLCYPVIINKVPRGVLGFADEHSIPMTDSLKKFTLGVVDHLELFLENLYTKTRLYEAQQKLKLMEKQLNSVK